MSNGVIVTGYHWGVPGADRLEKHGSRYVYLPIA